MARFSLREFLVESNRIEGITRRQDILDDEETVAEGFLQLKTLSAGDLENLVDCFAGPNTPLRDKYGMDVKVGDHFPQKGGPEIRQRLEELLYLATQPLLTAAEKRFTPHAKAHWLHCQYESLYPFMDGNGRSGRLFWLWCMGGIEKAPLGFLHTFYYQTLDASDGR